MIPFPPAKLANPAEPLDVSTWTTRALDWLRVDEGEEDRVNELLAEVFGWIERYCQQPMFARSYRLYLPCFLDGWLAMDNVSAVTAVEYLADGETAFAELDDAAYRLEENRLYFGEAAQAIDGVKSVRITFTAGWDMDSLPGGLQLPIRAMLAKLYDNRDGEKDYTGIQFLLQDYKMYHL